MDVAWASAVAKKPWAAVLFDMDGTLVDSAAMVTRRFAETFRHFDVQVPSPAELHSLVGPSAETTMVKYLGPEAKAEGIIFYRELAKRDGVSGLELFSGVRELIARLEANSVKMAVATSKPEEEAKNILRHFGILESFEVVSGASDARGIHHKADVIRGAVDRLSLETGESSIMVGDRFFDIEGAAECGIPSLFVAWGGADSIEAEGAIRSFEMPNDLSDFLLGIVDTDSRVSP
ncbi:MAG: HAD hydrolase-like protein [Actinomycetales bacterium]|nr:HAD hydrolase-like protein [Actinomycetales bacterium]